MDWIELANESLNTNAEVLSFYDYMDHFNKDPMKHLRPSYKYLADMMKYFGQDINDNWKLFVKEDHEAPPVYGEEKIISLLLQNLRNFEEEGFNSKFILLVGPNGSAKSSIIKKLMKGAEEYSETDAGALYTFEWVFPLTNVVKGTLGLNQHHESKDLRSFAYLDDKDITAIMPSELKDHPILLIPLEFRQKIIEEAFKDNAEQLELAKKSYLYRGDLSKRNRMIYDALLKNYKGKHNEVLKHIRIERLKISKRYSAGAVTIEPQLHVDARMQQITMDKRLATLPPSLQSLNLFSLQGEVILANRGILEFSDLLKRPLDAFKYLLMTMETGSINIGGILTQLDIFFIGTSNEVHLAAFKQHPDYNSFKGRFTFIKVPYLLDYALEEKIYNNQIKGLTEHTKFEPHAITALCKFAVMTRIRACMGKHYDDTKLTSIVTGLTPLEKINLYAGQIEIPDRLNSEQAQQLRHGVEVLKSEFENDNLYEGKFGISPRDLKNIIYKLSDLHEVVTFIEVIEYLGKLVQKKNEYDFLNMSTHGDYHNPPRFLELIKIEYLDQFDKELRDSLGLIDDRSYEDYIKRYIENVNSVIKGEKVKNIVTGKYEVADQYFIKEFESNINLKEDAVSFRSHLISKLGAWYLDHPKKAIVYNEVFPDVVTRLQESFRNEQKKVINNLSNNLVYFMAEMEDETKQTHINLSKDERKQIETVIENLKTKYGYSQKGALELIEFIIKERY